MTMVKEKFRESIRFRFLSILALVLALGAGVATTVVAMLEEDTLEHSLTTKGASFASYIAKLSQDPLIMKDSIQLDSLVSLANKDEDICYTVITDAQGTFITSQYASMNYTVPRFKAILSGLPRDRELPDMIAAIKQKESIIELSVPIRTGADTIGAVIIGLSEYTIHGQIRETILSVIALNVLVAVFLGVILFKYSRKTILDPISELGHAANRIAEGDLSTHVQIETTGEIRALIDDFNQMAANLEKTTVSRNYLDEIIGSMSDALIVVSPDRTITQVNAATTAFLGYHETELVGRPMNIILPVEEEANRDPLAPLLEQGLESVNSVETTFRTRVGEKIPMLISASVLRSKNGGVEGVVCAARDITERKKAEEELKKSALDIKEMYDELRTFSYITYHDLRAPLVNIKGFTKELDSGVRELGHLRAEVLEHLEESQRARYLQVVEQDIPEALKFIDSSAGRIDMLINSILKLSRVERRKIVRDTVRTEQMVRAILNALAHQIRSRGISVMVGRLPDLVTDPTVLEQIIGNLLDNAIKYLDRDRPGEISITAEQSDGQTIFHIQDNGRGMAAEDIPRSFESFRRLGKQDVPGEGMGLAYVKTSVRKLGGRVWCESTPGRGSTFSFSLPFTERVSSPGGVPGAN